MTKLMVKGWVVWPCEFAICRRSPGGGMWYLNVASVVELVGDNEVAPCEGVEQQVLVPLRAAAKEGPCL